MKHLRFWLRHGEYWDECPRCQGKKHMQERIDKTGLLVYFIAYCWSLRVRRHTVVERVKCWLCEGRGRRLHRIGYVLY
jgi:hypothetical protein